MTHPILSRIPVLRDFVDERFLEHRRRSTSLAGLICLLVTGILFEYRYFHDQIWSNDLLALILIFAVVKFSMMAWYRIKD
jgi:uncharacterized membrane protein YhhN